jgi:hypothetical protein
MRHWLRLLPAVALTFLLSVFVPAVYSVVIGALITVATGFYSVRQLHQLSGGPSGNQVAAAVMRRLPTSLRKLVRRKDSP